MSLKYLLDTNICIYLIKARPEYVIKKFLACKPGEIGISTIVLAELEYGVSKSQKVVENRNALRKLLRPIELVNFDFDAAKAYGDLRKNLETAGQPIGSLDYLIAAQALSLNVILVTNNEKEFSRIDGLKIENWSMQDL